ncbi:MAG: ATP-binding protein [Bacteroidota bacterium]
MKSQIKPSNPFILTGYHSPEYFCNRENELSWLREQLFNERNIVLYAERRVGKSALIKHLFHHLKQEKSAETIFVDFLGTSNIQSANQKIGSAIIEHFGDMRKGLKSGLLKIASSLGATLSFDPLSGLPKITFTHKQPEQINNQSLDIIGNYLLESKKKIVIAIDEFQEITRYPEKEAEALFRSWTQKYPMIRFVFSGSYRHMMESMFSNADRPFYRSAQLYQLSTIGEQVYSRFIHKHFDKAKRKIPTDILKEVFRWTRMQTYYVQLVCNKLFGLKKEINSVTLISVFHEVMAQEVPLFSNFQKLLTTFQWKLLVALAKEEVALNPMGKDFINRYGLGTPSSVSTALKRLLDYEMIDQIEGYRVQDVLLMRWLQSLN